MLKGLFNEDTEEGKKNINKAVIMYGILILFGSV